MHLILPVLLNEPQRPTLLGLTRGATLIAPASAYWEVGDSLSAMLKRERITLSMAQAVVAAYRRIPIRQQQVDLEGALEIAAQLDLNAYDAYLLRCAIDRGAPLMTLD